LFLIAISPANTPAQVVRPLTLEGKTALYQRVIAIPGAQLVKDAGAATGAAVTPFKVFYVYDRRIQNGREFLQVGTSNNGNITGWLDADQAIEWKQTLTVSFKDPAMQQRVLLFENRSAVKQLVDRHDIGAWNELWQQAATGIRVDSPVIAMQPEGYINIRKNFYLVPILSHEDILIGSYQGRLLQVATVPLRDPSALGESFRTGVVFVIDTTISMGPYIEVTRSTMQRVYQAIEEAQVTGQVNFGVVAYRDNTSAVPGLEYATRMYLSPVDGTSGEAFQSAIRQAQPATVSSQGFNEDAYAGIKQAIEGIKWEDFDARYLILVTDAGPRISGDLLSTTGLDTESLRRLAMRTGLQEIRSFVGLVVQSDELGTSLVDLLRNYSADMRFRRLNHAEKAAAQAATKMLIPIFFFIFPTVFILMLSPMIKNVFASGGLGF